MGVEQLDWDRLLDGGKYEINSEAIGCTFLQVRTRTYHEANTRSVAVRTHRVRGTGKLVIQAFAFADQVPGEAEQVVVTELPFTPFVDFYSGMKERERPVGGVTPKAPVQPYVAPAVIYPSLPDDHDPDDYSDTCTCGSYPKCHPSCLNYLDKQQRDEIRAKPPADYDAWKAAAIAHRAQADAAGSNGHKPVPSALTAPASDTPDPDSGS